MRRALLIALASLVFVSEAQAQTPEKTRALVVAGAQAFPSSPCEGRVSIVRMNMDELKALTGWQPSTKEPGGAAYQNNADGSCRVFILDTVLDGSGDAYNLCLVYVHEYGHLAGANHGDPGMGNYGDRYAPCLPLRPWLTPAQAKNVLANRLRDYRVSCRADGNASLCRATKRMKSGRLLKKAYVLHIPGLGEPIKIERLEWWIGV